MKKQYIIPVLKVVSVEALQAILGFSIGPKPQPGAPVRQGDGTKVKLTKMYI